MVCQCTYVLYVCRLLGQKKSACYIYTLGRSSFPVEDGRRTPQKTRKHTPHDMLSSISPDLYSSFSFKRSLAEAMPSVPTELLNSQFSSFLSWMYNASLDIRVPLTIGTVYAVSVHLTNHSQRIKNRQPLAFAKTQLFKWLCVLHNAALCLYSAWTFVGIIAAVRTAYNYNMSLQQHDLASPAFSFNTLWGSFCSLDSLWETGLNYYGYWFYLSKFYEVVDTMIILAKGKPSSMLQTYHHTGAMFSMWAGIRFASPPIWIFVTFNSLIHTIMYFYYTLSTLKIKVPKLLKASLTTAQITQIVGGGILAASHAFIYYHDLESKTMCSCLTTQGQFFALAVNVIYLSPLTYLFVAFWIRSYVKSRK